MSKQDTRNQDESGLNGSNQTSDEAKREMRTKAFRIALEMVAVFGIPAVAALIVGGWLESQYGSWVTYTLLALAFITSWIIVYLRVRSFARTLEKSKEDHSTNDNDSTVNEEVNHG